jgi:SOS-response transcriptional repressor LexA
MLPHESCLTIRAPDDSMSPLLERGDAVVVDPTSREVEEDTLVVLRIGEHTVVRMVKIVGTRVLFRAMEGHMPDLARGRECEVVGVVIGLAGRSMRGKGIDLMSGIATDIP